MFSPGLSSLNGSTVADHKVIPTCETDGKTFLEFNTEL